jgi:hypothetical protein
MSISEMKVLAFEKLSALNEESAIKEILLHLEELNQSKPPFDTDAFFEKASTKYDDVLQKLAQ